MVGLEIIASIQPEQRQEFLQTIDMFRRQPDEDKARISCSIFETVGMPNQFIWIEKWAGQEPLDAYLHSRRFKALLGSIRVLGELNSLQIAEVKKLNGLPG
jgi:quinol monooxygenase YgiN